jgi:hypothetical protein
MTPTASMLYKHRVHNVIRGTQRFGTKFTKMRYCSSEAALTWPLGHTEDCPNTDRSLPPFCSPHCRPSGRAAFLRHVHTQSPPWPPTVLELGLIGCPIVQDFLVTQRTTNWRQRWRDHSSKLIAQHRLDSIVWLPVCERKFSPKSTIALYCMLSVHMQQRWIL